MNKAFNRIVEDRCLEAMKLYDLCIHITFILYHLNNYRLTLLIQPDKFFKSTIKQLAEQLIYYDNLHQF